MANTLPLVQRKCSNYHKDQRALDGTQLGEFVKQVNREWRLSEDQKTISRRFGFKNYYQTIAFVNAVAWIANAEDHHPDLEVSYKNCTVNYSTHSLGGLSPNDFICAAKIDALIE